MNWNNGLLADYKWCREISNIDIKRRLGGICAEMAKNGDVIGVGTGSASYIALCELAARGLDVAVIPAAAEIELACAALGVRTLSLTEAKPDWSFDGADEIGDNGDVIKGRGAGLFIEKLIIAASPRRFLLAEERKFVRRVGGVPVPVEVFPKALHIAEESLRSLGADEIKLRLAYAKDGPVITEAGNLLLDCRFPEIRPALERDIKAIPGVIDSGLFQGYGFSFVRLEKM